MIGFKVGEDGSRGRARQRQGFRMVGALPAAFKGRDAATAPGLQAPGCG